MKDTFLIKYSFYNKNDILEEYEETRQDYSIDVAIGRTVRSIRQTVLKGRRDAKEITIVASKVENKNKVNEIEEETENWQGPICLVCGQPEDEDGRCGCTNKDSN